MWPCSSTPWRRAAHVEPVRRFGPLVCIGFPPLGPGFPVRDRPCGPRCHRQASQAARAKPSDRGGAVTAPTEPRRRFHPSSPQRHFSCPPHRQAPLNRPVGVLLINSLDTLPPPDATAAADQARTHRASRHERPLRHSEERPPRLPTSRFPGRQRVWGPGRHIRALPETE